MLKVLFIADGSLDRPLLHSQGIPLLRCLNQRGVECYVISFETNLDATTGALGADLEHQNITWLPVLVDEKASGWQRINMILGGFLAAFRLCRRKKISLVHSRSYRPAVMGLLLKSILGCGFLFDMRGFLIDELVADGRWSRDTLKYRLAKQVESYLILGADVLTVTSPQFKNSVLSLPYVLPERSDDVIVIPNCVDCDRFSLFELEARDASRTRLGWSDRLVAFFAGDAFRYRDTLEDIVLFFEILSSVRSDAYLVVAVTGRPEDIMPERLEKFGKQVTVITVPSQDMPVYLSSADIGISFFQSKNFANSIASPVKFGEYLSSGLPVVINPGIGDTARIVEQYQVGVVLDPKDIEQVRAGVSRLLDLLSTVPDLRERCHAASEHELSLDLAVERYVQSYQRVVNKHEGVNFE